MPAAALALTGWAAVAWNVAVLVITNLAASTFKPTVRDWDRNKRNEFREVTVRGTVEPRKLLYGQVRTGGCLVHACVSGQLNERLVYVIALAGHQIDSITEFNVDNTRIALSDIATIHNSTTQEGDVLLSRFTSTVASDTAPHKLSIHYSLGTSSGNGTYPNTVNSVFPPHNPTSFNDFLITIMGASEWDSSHIGKGIPLAVFILTYDDVVWRSGAPQDFFTVAKGRKLYDPRLDSTNGGSGAHRLTDATTWAWSNNPALAIADYITGGAIVYDTTTPDRRLTLAESTSRIDWPAVITAANVCDQSVTVPIPVLQGVLTWTNGNATVTGVNSAFTKQLVSGNYIYAPNNTFVQLASTPTSDTSLTLTANYAGSTVVDPSNQYFTSATSTTTEQRYTCDTQLSLGSTNLDNLKILLSSMVGHCVYSRGKYYVKAAAYQAATIALTEHDITESFDILTHADQSKNYNVVQGTFYDEDRNWALSDFPPPTSSTYQTDDSSVDTINIELHATRGYYRAQRIAYLHLLQGRNQQVINIKGAAGAARKLAPLDVFTLPIGFFGITTEEWIAEEVRIRADGFVDITARITSASSFTDLATGSYKLPDSSNAGGLSVATKPSDPTGLTITSYPQLYVFEVLGTFTPDTSFELWEYTSNTPFSSATKLYAGNSTRITISKRDTTTRYYWVRAKLNGQFSATYPTGNGSAATADLTQTTDMSANAATLTHAVQVSSVSITTLSGTPLISHVQNFASITFTPPVSCTLRCIVTGVAKYTNGTTGLTPSFKFAIYNNSSLSYVYSFPAKSATNGDITNMPFSITQEISCTGGVSTTISACGAKLDSTDTLSIEIADLSVEEIRR